MNADTILYLDEWATRRACRHFDPVEVVAAAHHRALTAAPDGPPAVVDVAGDPRLTVLVDRWVWLDACLISSAYLAGLRTAATAAAVASHLLRGLPLTVAVLGGTPELVEALVRTLPGIVHLSLFGAAHAALGQRLLDHDDVNRAGDAADAVYGANLVLADPSIVVSPRWLAPDVVVLGGDGSLRLPALFGRDPQEEGVRLVNADDGGIAATALATEVYRVALRLGLGQRLAR